MSGTRTAGMSGRIFRTVHVVTTARTLLIDDVLGYAVRHAAVQVIFQHTVGEIGWRAHVHSCGGACLLTFPWTDQIDRELMRNSKRIPYGGGLDEVWSDVDQCWFGEVLPLADDVFIAETEDDGWSPEPRGVATFQPDPMGRVGHVRVNRADVRLSVVARTEWDRAWRQARTACLAGSPEPAVIQWADTAAHRDEQAERTAT